MNNMFQKLLDFLNRLDESGLTYTLEHNRDDAVLVCVSRDNERWEVEFLADGEIDVEVFYSDVEENGLEDEEALERLFEDSDDEIDEELEEEVLED